MAHGYVDIFSYQGSTNTNTSQVVVDPTINPQFMEMYADEEARGGVLEPEGIVGIKFRRDRQLATMTRLDATYAELQKKLATASPEQQAEIKDQIVARENLLLPVYSQISLQYADLHDRAGRMQAKGTIRMALTWKNARRFFYWRVRRRTNEEHILIRMAAAAPKDPSNNSSAAAARAMDLQKLAAWTNITDFDTADEKVAHWYEEHIKDISAKIDDMKTEAVAYDVAAMLRNNRAGGLKGVAQVIGMLPAGEREEVLKQLSAV